MNVCEVINKVSATAGLSNKIAILKENRTALLDYIFHEMTVKHYVTGDNIRGKTFIRIQEGTFEDNIAALNNLCYDLSRRKITGNEAIMATMNFLGNLNNECEQVFLNILDGNLKCGISYEKYETEVMGKKSSQFKVTLAQHLEDVNGVDVLDGTWYASRKCDGVRCVAFVDTFANEVHFISRQGKEFTTLDNLKKEMLNFAKINWCGRWVFDGELCKIDENGDEHFDQIVGECKKKDYSITECCYQLFDVVEEKVFNKEIPAMKSFTDRYGTLKSALEKYVAIEPCFIRVLEQELLHSQEDFDRWENKVEVGNWEGFMLRKDVPFEVGRTKNLLKVKKFHDLEAVVKRVENGILTTAEPGKGNVQYEGVTALVIEYKGNEVHVGSGLTKEQRIVWHNDPESIIGKTICVKYFQESRNATTGEYSLRFPTLKYVYENGRDC